MNKEFLFAILVALILTIIGFGHIVKPGEMLYSPHSDIMTATLSQQSVLYDSISSEGALPLWRSDQLSGRPAFTKPGSMYTYPFHFLFYLASPEKVVGWTIFIHIFLSGIVFYILGRILGLNFASGLIMLTAAIFNYKLIIAVYAGWIPVIPTLVWLPALFASVIYLMDNPGLKGCLFTIISGALCLHTGGVQIIYYGILFLIFLFVFKAIPLIKTKKWFVLMRTSGWLLLSLLISLGLIAYLLLPQIVDSSLVARAAMPFNSFKDFIYVKGLDHLSTLIYPLSLDIDFEMFQLSAYFGIITLVFGCIGIITTWRNTITHYLIISFLLSLIIPLVMPILSFVHMVVPGFALFKVPARLFFLSSFFGIMLAGIGFNKCYFYFKDRFNKRLVTVLFTTIVILSIASIGVFYSYKYLYTKSYDEVLPNNKYRTFLNNDEEVFRIAPFFKTTVNYGWSAPFGLEMITGYDPINLNYYQTLFAISQSGIYSPIVSAASWLNIHYIKRSDLIDILNVKYIILPKPIEDAGKYNYKLIAHYSNEVKYIFYKGFVLGDIYIYENENFLKRAFWIKNIFLVKSEEEAIAVILRYDLRNSAVVMGDLNINEELKVPDKEDIDIVKAKGNSRIFRTQTEVGGYLVISEIWHPGWKANLDGKEHPLYRTDLALMGTVIPPGKHELVLNFEPPYFYLGLAISLLAGLIFIVLCILFFVRSRRS